MRILHQLFYLVCFSSVCFTLLQDCLTIRKAIKLSSFYCVTIFGLVDEADEVSIKDAAEMIAESMNFDKNEMQVNSVRQFNSNRCNLLYISM